jgi:drug/metabolite transporter (DMT)-like permease
MDVNLRAIGAIVKARLIAQRRVIASCSVAAVLVAFLQPHGIPNVDNSLEADLLTRGVWLAGPAFFCGMLGIVVAMIQRGGERMRQLELLENSAPLYGRELARATAVVPCIAATIATVAYWIAQFVAGFAAAPTFFVLALASVLATTLVALSATLRRGTARWLYIGLACATSAVAYLLAVYADTFGPAPGRLGHYPDAIGVGTELAFCAVVGFIALRQYGEALARYDPVPE